MPAKATSLREDVNMSNLKATAMDSVQGGRRKEGRPLTGRILLAIACGFFVIALVLLVAGGGIARSGIALLAALSSGLIGFLHDHRKANPSQS
jgi:hypothetical protein